MSSGSLRFACSDRHNCASHNGRCCRPNSNILFETVVADVTFKSHSTDSETATPRMPCIADVATPLNLQ